MSSDKKKILILGGTGFIGRNLVNHFIKLNKYEMHATHFQSPTYDAEGVIWHQVDLKNPAEIDQLLKEKHIVIQAAATTSGSKDIVQKPFLHVTDNAIMNSYLLRSCFEQSIEHFIFPSCTVMYNSSDSPIQEQDFEADNIHPRYFGVAWTKVYVEKMCEFYSRLGQTKYTVIRHSNIYGPYDKFDLEKSHVFGATITKAMTAKDGKIAVWGDGQEVRDLLYIDDLCRFIQISIERQVSKFELMNLGLGVGTSIKALTEKIVMACGRKLNIFYDTSKPSIPTKIFLNTSKAQAWGWSPKFSLDEGIAKTINWYKENISYEN